MLVLDIDNQPVPLRLPADAGLRDTRQLPYEYIVEDNRNDADGIQVQYLDIQADTVFDIQGQSCPEGRFTPTLHCRKWLQN